MGVLSNIAETPVTHKQENSGHQFKVLFELAPDACYVSDLQGILIDGNKAAEEITGYRKEELIGQNFLTLGLLSRDRSLKAAQLLALNLLGQSTGPDEFSLKRKDGTQVIVEIRTSPVEIEGRHLVLGIARDITAHKLLEEEQQRLVLAYQEHDRILSASHIELEKALANTRRKEREIRRLKAELEKRVIERTAQLQASNKELDAFMYSVSHDLRAPLRSIDGFSQMLLEDCADSLNENGQDYLRRVRAAAQHMGRLIDDLLELSRLTRRELRQEQIDLSNMVRDTAVEVWMTQPERKVEWLIQENMNATGDTTLLQVVLDNLLGNAWKFTGKKPCARIEFGTMQRNKETVYFVRDNGAGLDMTYIDKLFTPFRRLHTVEEFEGTGLGLATVKRIIHAHGGQVWAEGAVEQGATFYFTLGR